MDLFLSSVFILGVLTWLIPLVGICIVLESKGPVFFIQKRAKRYGGVYWCVKFRTMRPNAQSDIAVAYEQDPRITRLGGWLRRYHIDELPQLLNVWWGDMSLIGPRPYMLMEDQYYQNRLEGYTRRSLVKPGITGLAQAQGYFGGTSDLNLMHQRLLMDIAYVHSWSPALDWVILCQTFGYLLPFKSTFWNRHEIPVEYI
jgi:putative colanic acid biosynthesis UDP-glucose lipid carrier transferase